MTNVSFSSDYGSEQEYIEALKRDLIGFSLGTSYSIRLGVINREMSEKARLANFLLTVCDIHVPREFTLPTSN